MRPQSRLLFNASALLFGALLATAACTKSAGGGGTLPVPTPTPPTTVTFTVAAGGSTQSIPAAFGFTGTVAFPAATAGAGATFTIAESGFQPPSGVPVLGPPNAPLLYFTFSVTAAVTFTGFPAITITIPSNITTSGQQFFLAFFDPNNPGTGWQTSFRGPGTISGQTISFPGKSTPYSLAPGLNYAYVLYALPAGTTPTPPPVTRFIYESNSSNTTGLRNTILIFPANANGNVTPTSNLAGGGTQLNNPNGLAFGTGSTGGRLYVANGGGTITEYAPPAMGNQSPTVVLGGGASGLVSPQFVAVDLTGQAYVTQNTLTGGADSVEVFAANAGLGSAPTLTITAGLNKPFGVGVDAMNNIYVANFGNNSINVYDKTGKQTMTVSGALTTLKAPTGLAVDGTGDVWVAQANSILMFKGPLAAGNNNVAPKLTVTGGSTLLNMPEELWLDGHNTLFTANNGTGANANALLTFPNNANGNVFPTQFINGPLTQLAQPFGVTAF